MTHGGILATIADEAMSWAVTANGDLGVTARMSLAFRQPAHLGQQLRVEAWALSRRARTIEARSEIRAVVSETLLADAGRSALRPRLAGAGGSLSGVVWRAD